MRPRRIQPAWSLLATVLMVVIVGSLLFIQSRRVEDRALAIVRMEQLTTDGQAERSSMSRDGRYVVHIKEGSGRPSVWLRQTRTGSDVEIIPPADVFYTVLTLSPDGDHVYFARFPISGDARNITTLYKIPVLGGPPQQVLVDVDGGIAFSPSGDQLAFVRGSLSGQTALMIAGIDGTGERVLASIGDDKGNFRFAVEPAWSADGRTVLMPTVTKVGMEIVVVDVQTGGMTSGGAWISISAVEWLPGGKSYVVVGKRESDPASQIWHVEYPSHRHRRITNDLSDYAGVAVQADGRRLSTIQRATVSHVWVLDAETADSARQITADRNSDGAYGVAWTSDERIVFTSLRSGFRSLWIMNADGSAARQLPLLPPLSPWEPKVSPDGKVFFHGFDSGGHRIWRVGLDGTPAQPLTPGPFDSTPVLSEDGGRLYFLSSNVSTMVIDRAAGASGRPTAVKQMYAPIAATKDGRLLGISNGPQYQPAILEANGELRMLPSLALTLHPINPTLSLPVLFADGGRSLIFPATRDGVVNLWLKTTSGDKQITRFDRGRIFGFDQSPSGRIVVSRGHIQSDVVLLHVE